MKLNYKNTIKSACICDNYAFWQAYDFVAPLLLDNITDCPTISEDDYGT